jgi:hypothetical protein
VSESAFPQNQCSRPSPFGHAVGLVYRPGHDKKEERANDQSGYRYRSVLLHGRIRYWNRHRRREPADLISLTACAVIDDRPQSRDIHVTLGHIRGHGCGDLLVYCNSINCSHDVTLNADHLPDDTPIRPLGLGMVCTKCGHVGADVRPDWSPHVNKRHV